MIDLISFSKLLFSGYGFGDYRLLQLAQQRYPPLLSRYHRVNSPTILIQICRNRLDVEVGGGALVVLRTTGEVVRNMFFRECLIKNAHDDIKDCTDSQALEGQPGVLSDSIYPSFS